MAGGLTDVGDDQFMDASAPLNNSTYTVPKLTKFERGEGSSLLFSILKFLHLSLHQESHGYPAPRGTELGGDAITSYTDDISSPDTERTVLLPRKRNAGEKIPGFTSEEELL